MEPKEEQFDPSVVRFVLYQVILDYLRQQDGPQVGLIATRLKISRQEQEKVNLVELQTQLAEVITATLLKALPEGDAYQNGMPTFQGTHIETAKVYAQVLMNYRNAIRNKRKVSVYANKYKPPIESNTIITTSDSKTKASGIPNPELQKRLKSDRKAPEDPPQEEEIKFEKSPQQPHTPVDKEAPKMIIEDAEESMAKRLRPRRENRKKRHTEDDDDLFNEDEFIAAPQTRKPSQPKKPVGVTQPQPAASNHVTPVSPASTQQVPISPVGNKKPVLPTGDVTGWNSTGAPVRGGAAMAGMASSQISTGTNKIRASRVAGGGYEVQKNAMGCFCNKMDPKMLSNALADRSIVRCCYCMNPFHKTCVRYSKVDTPEFYECPSCLLQHLYPFKSVDSLLVNAYVLDNQKKTIDLDEMRYNMLAPTKDGFDPEKQAQSNYYIEVRCINLEGAMSEPTWPNKGKINMNGFEIASFQPLTVQSAQHKRKDRPIRVPFDAVRRGANTIEVMDDRISVSKQQNLKIFKYHALVVGIYLVKEMDRNDLWDQVKAITTGDAVAIPTQLRLKVLSQDDSRAFIRKQFLLSGVETSRIQVKVMCPLDRQQIKNPVRGKSCNHLSCFNVMNFIDIMSKSKNEEWRCPICKSRCHDLLFDQYFADVVKKCSESMIDPAKLEEVVFDDKGNFEQRSPNSSALAREHAKTYEMPLNDENANDDVIFVAVSKPSVQKKIHVPGSSAATETSCTPEFLSEIMSEVQTQQTQYLASKSNQTIAQILSETRLTSQPNLPMASLIEQSLGLGAGGVNGSMQARSTLSNPSYSYLAQLAAAGGGNPLLAAAHGNPGGYMMPGYMPTALNNNWLFLNRQPPSAQQYLFPGGAAANAAQSYLLGGGGGNAAASNLLLLGNQGLSHYLNDIILGGANPLMQSAVNQQNAAAAAAGVANHRQDMNQAAGQNQMRNKQYPVQIAKPTPIHPTGQANAQGAQNGMQVPNTNVAQGASRGLSGLGALMTNRNGAEPMDGTSVQHLGNQRI